jgi:actin-like ATPase involved in cell morphogenesis
VTATSYSIGIDLGTTYTAAAVHRDGSATIFLLGSRGATIPSLVFLRDDQAILTGEAAERRGIVEPARLAREFKRRVGDSAPIMLGHAPYSAERLMAALLKEVVAAVATREGSSADHVAVSHPANWGPFKIDLLRHALDLAGLRTVTLLTEPVAAAVHYASKERVETDSVVAVYDLGGGTFDAAVLRKTDAAGAFETLGEPEGIERLGGIDFDEAVFAYVRNQLGGKVDELDGTDPSVRVAIGRLRRECVAAKEALSSDSETTIPVALPNVHTDIRLTRAEFEPMIQPAITETIEALRRAVERAGVRPDDLASVLLVGGSSQIPLVSQMVSNALGRPVAVDAHPKHSVAMGASMVAARAGAPALAAAAAGAGANGLAPAPVAAAAPAPAPMAAPTPAPLAEPQAGSSAFLSPNVTQDSSAASASQPPPSDPPVGGRRRGRGRPGRAVEAPAQPGQVHGSAGVAPVVDSGAAARGNGHGAGGATPAPSPAGSPTPGAGRAGGGNGRRIGLAAAAVALVVAAALGAYTLGSGKGDAQEKDRTSETTGAPSDDAAATDPSGGGPTTTAAPEDAASCESESGRCAHISAIRVSGDHYVADYTVDGFDPLTRENGGTADDHHVHFFFDTTPPENAGANGPSPGVWTVWDLIDAGGALTFDEAAVADAQDLGASQLCVLVADAGHGVEQGTGNCVDLPS